MAKKYNKRRHNTDSEDQDELDQEPIIAPETKREIWVIILFSLCVLTILSLSGLAGSVGRLVNDGIKQLFGWGRYLVPIILLGWGYMLIRTSKFILRTTNYVGLLVFVITFSSFLHLFIPLDEATSAIVDGRGGGYLGFLLSFPFQKIMGFWASLVVIVAFCLISILIIFNTTLRQLSKKPTEVSGFFDGLTSMFSFLRRSSYDENKEDGDKPEEEDEDEAEFKQTEVQETDEEEPNSTEDQEPPVKPRSKKIDIPINLLDDKNIRPTSGDIDGNAEIIRKTLENFNIDVEMGEVKVGPTVTQFTFRPAEGVKLSQITGLSNDLALALAAHPIRIEAPIPGKSLVGIEVPNQKVAIVGLRGIIDSKDFKKKIGGLTFGLGRDVAGNVVLANLESMPHLLIAGATGSGKSVCIHSLIISFLYQNSPEQLKFIMVDPKKVELISYSDIPHLLTPVITEVDKTINSLKWCVNEMDRRYHLLSESGKKNIAQYNNSVLVNKLPYIVIVIDELADLMSQVAQEVEGIIIRLAQMARAVGIHLIVSTQRPSVDVITGLIKANITSRIAFSVASLMDSRTILDYAGAEKLLGRGDMLFTSSELSKPRRIQGALVTEAEIDKVVNFLKNYSEPQYVEEVTEKQTSQSTSGFEDLGDDDLLSSAKDVVWRANKASASLLQRRLRIGYARAARLLDLLEEEGIIGPGDGAKPRDILIEEPDDNIDVPDNENEETEE
ncbi:DNA translocase FtsK [Patescibacteria group bacterium]|nr:DNA translocase FtsK [Patescibacteria group bacterium]MBU1890596.1 DNA translocase FtsK [Patescibacteria group bacterium]